MCDPVFLLCLDVYMIMCLVLNKNILKKKQLFEVGD